MARVRIEEVHLVQDACQQEKPVWQASLEPILGPPEPYDMMSDLRVGEIVDFVLSLTTKFWTPLPDP